MRPSTRADVRVAIVRVTAQGDAPLTLEELAALVGLSSSRLERFVQIGLVQPIPPETKLFPATAAVRLKRLLRLRRGLEVHLAGAAVIVDLLERLEQLEAELARVKRSRTADSLPAERAPGE